MNLPNNSRYLSEIHRLKTAQYERCLWHTMTCAKKPIKAHAIQNSRALDGLAEDGHVVMFKPELNGVQLGLLFKRVGRNLATTFTGLCSEHDTLIFRPIDTNEIDQNNAEQRFLVAYRAVLKEFHAALATGQMVQLSFQKGVELGQFREDGPEMGLANEAIIKGILAAQFTQPFHEMYVSKDWNRLRHVTLLIRTPSPALAASGVCLPAEAQSMLNKDVRPFLTFSMFPQSTSLYVQFAWLPESDAVMRQVTDPIATVQGQPQLRMLSKFILKYTETFTLKPSVFESFSGPQVQEMTRYFLANATGTRQEWDHPRLYLFGPVA